MTVVSARTAISCEPRDLIAGIEADITDRRNSIGLAAFENVLSSTARRMLSVDLADRYLIADHTSRGGRRSWINGGLLCSGYPGVDELESAATKAAATMFGASWIDFRPLSGLHATICTVTTMTRPGDLVYSISPADGGHFATRALLEFTGRGSEYLAWSSAMTVDLDGLRRQWRQRPGHMVVFDHGTPLRSLPVAAVRDIVGPDVVLVYDASHTLGLIAGGRFQDPLAEGCDVLQGNTHKSFPGAHKGLIAFADAETGRRVSAAIGGAMVSSQNTGATLANYVTALEMAEHATGYARQMIGNRTALCEALADAGADLHNPSGSDPRTASASHVILVRAIAGRQGYELAQDLIEAGIHLNARPVGDRVMLRIGVQEVTRLGMTADDMVVVARLIGRVARCEPFTQVWRDVVALGRRHRSVRYSFDADADGLPDAVRPGRVAQTQRRSQLALVAAVRS